MVDLFTKARCFDPKGLLQLQKMQNKSLYHLIFENFFPYPIFKHFATEEGPVEAETSCFSKQVYHVIPFPIP